MDLKEHLERLDSLAVDRNEWKRTVRFLSQLNAQRFTAEVGPLRLVISNDDAGTEWFVENHVEQRMVSNYWKPAAGVAQAMRESTDFARAYLHTVANPQHLEA